MSMEQEDPTCPDCGMPLRLGHSFDCPQHPETVKKEEKYAGRPEPKGAKRFELSEDPIIREKVTIYREGFRKLQATHPEVIGATLFGSSVKGRAVGESDVDSAIFVDAQRAAERNNSFSTHTDIREESDGTKEIQTLFNPVAGYYYFTELNKHVNSRSQNNGGIIVEHATVFPMSPEILKLHLDIYIQSTQDFFSYHCAVINDRVNQSRNGKQATPSTESTQLEPSFFLPSSDITSLFHLQIGHGLDKYRQEVIERLEDNPYGEYAWRNICDSVEIFEGWSQRSGKRFPRRLAQARKTYIKTTEPVENSTRDHLDHEASKYLDDFLDMIVDSTTFKPQDYVQGITKYQYDLLRLAIKRSGEDFQTWSEYWTAKGYIDAYALYAGLEMVEEGIQPILDSLNRSINALQDENLKREWREKADQLIATKKIA